MARAKQYDRRYFDKWYRNPKSRISTAALTERKAAVALSVAEYFLERKVRTVLDLGCGEGQWQPLLKRLRPGIRYTGVDSSEYAIERYGRQRNLLFGHLGDLGQVKLASSYDLIVCSDALCYLPRKDLIRAISAMSAHLGGVAFLEAYATDRIKGDMHGVEGRTAEFYRKIFRECGLIFCGPHCYVGPTLAERVTALERGAI